MLDILAVILSIVFIPIGLALFFIGGPFFLLMCVFNFENACKLTSVSIIEYSVVLFGALMLSHAQRIRLWTLLRTQPLPVVFRELFKFQFKAATPEQPKMPDRETYKQLIRDSLRHYRFAPSYMVKVDAVAESLYRYAESAVARKEEVRASPHLKNIHDPAAMSIRAVIHHLPEEILPLLAKESPSPFTVSLASYAPPTLELASTVESFMNSHSAYQTPYITINALRNDEKPKQKEIDTAILDQFTTSPFMRLLYHPVPFELTERFSHHWIIAPPKTGKTTLLSALINCDLDLVVTGDASIFVMDSQNELIPNIAQNQRFAPGGDLAKKVVYLDFTDEHPVAINLFDLGLKRASSYGQADRDALYSTVYSTIDYIITGLLGQPMTPRQSTLFQFCVQLLLRLPNAGLRSFLELIAPNGEKPYQAEIARLDPEAQGFFRDMFNDKQARDTRQEVSARIYTVLSNPTVRRILTSPTTKLDLFSELNEGRVVLVNLSEYHLQSGLEVIGRFFIALLSMAATERMTLRPHQKKATYAYIDECHDIIGRDTKIIRILDQARKQNLGMILAHQRLAQINDNVLDALYGSTSIKMAAGVRDAAAYALARDMHTTPEFIHSQPLHHFAAFERGMKQAVSVEVPYVDFGKMPHMSIRQFAELRESMRQRYSNSEAGQEPQPEPVQNHRSNRPLDTEVSEPGPTVYLPPPKKDEW